MGEEMIDTEQNIWLNESGVKQWTGSEEARHDCQQDIAHQAGRESKPPEQQVAAKVGQTFLLGEQVHRKQKATATQHLPVCIDCHSTATDLIMKKDLMVWVLFTTYRLS